MKRCLSQESDESEVLRCVWSPREDAALREASIKYKGECWNLVAECVKEVTSSSGQVKTAKQCRERWNNQLSPNVQLTPLSDIEIRRLFELHGEYGNSWSKISGRLPGRTDNIVKNYFLCRLRRLARNIRRGTIEEATPKDEEDLLQTLYLIDYLYRYYISPERHENIRKSLNAQTRKRKNGGDQYINKVVASDEGIVGKLSTFARELIASFKMDERKIKAYEYLVGLKASGNFAGSSIASNALHNEDGKTLSSPSVVQSVEVSGLELPLPRAEVNRKREMEDFVPKFTFAVYSLPCLSGLYQRGLIGELLAIHSNLVQ
eukprot:TRINITY_DN8705_c0_g1_i2.p1 TRINITY_DN8705_c0_g1~~TRINITY_DN8705_c0_g1_i2.p1  ORF type:complete len:319 (+),score=51.74 TRINITY_DN8705_c0_g1_i2:125-1081(+)